MSDPAFFRHSDGLAIRRSGCGDAVLWVHGYTLDSTIWDEVWDCLPGWCHIGIDLPGHGGSRPFNERDDLPSIAGAIAVVAKRLEARRIVGLSFGATVALQIAMTMKDQLEVLVLCAPGLGGGPVDPYAEARNQELRRLYSARGPGPWLRELWMSSPPNIFKGLESMPEKWVRLSGVIDRHSWRELADPRFHRIAAHRQSLSQIRQVTARTLILVGDEDMSAFKRTATLIARNLPTSVITYLAAAGHLALLQAPKEVCPLIERHLRGGVRRPLSDL